MKKIFFLLFICILTISLYSCKNPQKNDTNDTLESVYYSEPGKLNPYDLTNTTQLRVAANTTDGLVENDKYGRYVPAIATNWSHNDDYTEWTFTLRQDVYWVDHLGNKTNHKVTAEDFVNGLRYIGDPQNYVGTSIIRKLVVGLNDYYWTLADIDDGIITNITRENALATFDTNVGVVALDEYTVKYTLTNETPYFLSYLVTENFFPVEIDFLNQIGPENYGTSIDKLLYNGAYYLSTWQKDKKIELTKNAHYWDASKVNISKVSYEKVADAPLALEMFKRGEIDSVSLDGTQVRALKNTEWNEKIYSSEPGTVNYWFALNSQSQNQEFAAFINNPDFRKALYYGLDRVSLNNLYDPYNPESILINNIIPVGTIFDENGKDYTDYADVKAYKDLGNVYNKTLAEEYMQKAIAALVDENGNIESCTAGSVDWGTVAKFDIDCKLPLTIVYADSNDSDQIALANLIKAQLEDSLGTDNVHVIRGQSISDKYDDLVAPGYFDIVYDSFSFKYADPSAQLDRLASWGAVNDGRWEDTLYDEYVDDGYFETDLEQRYLNYAKAEKYFLDQGYIIPWKRSGGYEMSKIVPFTYQRGGFGVTRFRYKGMVLQTTFVTQSQYNELEAQFYQELESINQG